jgi:hypothetical protein
MAAVAEASSTNVDYEWPYRFEISPLDDLSIDETYQRPLTTFWKEVSEGFNPALVGTLIVSERRNGSKVIIDGQTRWSAMRERGLHDAPCLIYEGLSKADEAALFSDLQTQRRGMRSYHRFRAQLVARRPMAVDIAKIVTELGFELGKEETPNTLRSIAALEALYKIDRDHLADVMEIIQQAWGTQDKLATSAELIRGIGFFLRNQENVDIDRLINRLQGVTPSMVKHRASALREGNPSLKGGAQTYVAQAILGEYMRRAR